MLNKMSASVAGPVEKPLMQVQVTTGGTVHGPEDFIQRIEEETKSILSRFAPQIMSVEVHFTDENGAKKGSNDKRCLMEARCSGRPSVAVDAESSTIEGAFHVAAGKLQRLLESSLGKVDGHKGGDTIRGGNHLERDASE